MEHYKDEVLSQNLKTAELIYQKFNKELFNDEVRAHVFFKNIDARLKTIAIRKDKIYTNDLKYGIEIPTFLICQNSPIVPVWILAQMVLIYGEIKNLKLSSNRAIYKNKRFKKEADKVGLIVKYGTYGFEPVDITDNTRSLISSYQFIKSPIYTDSEKKKTSERHYIDSRGEKCIAHKEHIFYCLTGYPEDILNKVENFMSSMGIQPMMKLD